MSKRLFIFVSLFIILFGFNMNVEADDDKPTYIFTTEDADFFNAVCVDPFQLGYTYTNTANVYSAGNNNYNCWYKNNGEWFFFNGFEQHFEDLKQKSVVFGFQSIDVITPTDHLSGTGLKEHLAGMTCPEGNCLSYVIDTVCNKEYDNNKDVCDNLKASKDDATVRENINGNNEYSCPTNFKVVGKDKDTSGIFSLTLSYSEEDKKFDAKDASASGTWLEKSGDFFKSTSQSNVLNTYYLRSKNGTYGDFKSHFIEELTKGNCSSEMGALCLGTDSNENKDLHWYFEKSASDCTSDNGYIDGISQSMGYTANNDTVEYTDLLDAIDYYAKKLLGEKKELMEIASCDVLLSGGSDETTIADILKVIVNIVKFIVPVIFVVMGSIDFIQAIFAQDDGGMKKAQGRFIKRLIIAVVIFLIPYALKMVLTVANGIWPFISPDFCGVL